MIIGIDLDEVIAEQLDEIIKFYHKKTGRLITKDKFHTQYWPDVWKISPDEARLIDEEFKTSKHYEDILPVEGAVEAIINLVKNNELIIITSRAKMFKELTEKWVKSNLKGLDIKIVYSQDFDSEEEGRNRGRKAIVCKKLGVSHLIEDQSDFAINCAENGIKVLLLNKPWNVNCSSHENILRVNSWEEILNYFNGVKK